MRGGGIARQSVWTSHLKPLNLALPAVGLLNLQQCARCGVCRRHGGHINQMAKSARVDHQRTAWSSTNLLAFQMSGPVPSPCEIDSVREAVRFLRSSQVSLSNAADCRRICSCTGMTLRINCAHLDERDDGVVRDGKDAVLNRDERARVPHPSGDDRGGGIARSEAPGVAVNCGGERDSVEGAWSEAETQKPIPAAPARAKRGETGPIRE